MMGVSTVREQFNLGLLQDPQKKKKLRIPRKTKLLKEAYQTWRFPTKNYWGTSWKNSCLPDSYKKKLWKDSYNELLENFHKFSIGNIRRAPRTNFWRILWRNCWMFFRWNFRRIPKSYSKRIPRINSWRIFSRKNLEENAVQIK